MPFRLFTIQQKNLSSLCLLPHNGKNITVTFYLKDVLRERLSIAFLGNEAQSYFLLLIIYTCAVIMFTNGHLTCFLWDD